MYSTSFSSRAVILSSFPGRVLCSWISESRSAETPWYGMGSPLGARPARRPRPRVAWGRTAVSRLARRRKKRTMSVPDTIVVKRDLELRGRRHELGVRRALFGLLPLISLLALVNLFGQRPSRSNASAAKASLVVYAPERVRGGLLYEARFRVTARADVKKAVLVLDAGWLENITVNSIEPQPVSESSADGRLALDLGHLP